MTGRPSGRCAATEALEAADRIEAALDEWYARREAFTTRDYDRELDDALKAAEERLLVALEGYRVPRERAALASPCCCADQEQVKEALAFCATFIEHILSRQEAKAPDILAELDQQLAHVYAALALLGSHEEEER